jgi:NADPH:quinone reductase-like Zn-dependent oxidoreductase
MAAAPLNPSDLLMLSGEYGRSWAFPFVPGLEGSGRVVASGGGLLGRLVLGKAVAVAADESGLWAEWVTVPANRCVALPRDAALGAGAMSFVNPLTAIALVQEARRARHTSAISVAAGGALGRMIRARAATEGLEIINVVRRESQAAELRAEGARHVLATEAADFDARLAELCRQLGCRLAFDPVAGDTTRRLADALEPGGEVVLYGALSGQPLVLNPDAVLYKQITVRSFWLSRWLEGRSLFQMIRLTGQVTKALQGGFAESRVTRILPLERATEAPALYASAMSAGKVLIQIGTEPLGLEPHVG